MVSGHGHAVAARSPYAGRVGNIRKRSAVYLAMEHHEEALIAAKPLKVDPNGKPVSWDSAT